MVGSSTATIITNESDLEASKEINGDLGEDHAEIEDHLNGAIGKLYLWSLAMKVDEVAEQKESQLPLQVFMIAEFISICQHSRICHAMSEVSTALKLCRP